MDLAPVAVFVYRRPDHAKEALESLFACPESRRSPIYVFSDGPKHEREKDQVEATRAIVRQYANHGVRLIAQEENRGLAHSIIAGVTAMCSEHGKVIVIEDDLVVAPVFLDYMNYALEHYKDEGTVVQVSGYMHPIRASWNNDAAMLPLTSSWGWATWSRAWADFDAGIGPYEILKANTGLRRAFDLNGAYPYFAMLEANAKGLIDSWAVRWYASTFLAGGLTLWPRTTLVRNCGFDGSGTHGGSLAKQSRAALSDVPPLRRMPGPVVDDEIFGALKAFVGSQTSLSGKLHARLRVVLRKLRGTEE